MYSATCNCSHEITIGNMKLSEPKWNLKVNFYFGCLLNGLFYNKTLLVNCLEPFSISKPFTVLMSSGDL